VLVIALEAVSDQARQKVSVRRVAPRHRDNSAFVARAV